jgi:hypothetical protein
MSTISIAGGTQDLEYQFETSLARLYATDLVDELFDQFEHHSPVPEFLAEEILQLEAAVDADFAGAFSDWDQPEDYMAVDFEPISNSLQSTDFLQSTNLQSTRELSRAASAAAALPAPAVTPTQPTPTSSGIDYRLLFGFACASLFSTFCLWMLSQFYWSKQVAVVPPAQVVSQPTVDPATAKFAKYLDQALEVAGTQISTATQPAPNQAVAAAGAPQMSSDPNSVTANGQPVERVYIPVYQPPTVQPNQSSASVTSLPATPTAGIPLPPPPRPQVPGSLSGYVPNNSTKPVTMAAVMPATRPAPAARSKSNPSSKPITIATARPNVAAGNTILGNTTLIGVMELGERSTALIETNGATQRLTIGQSLGTTGWQVVQIADQKVVVQRGGELRALAVGQKF